MRYETMLSQMIEKTDAERTQQIDELNRKLNDLELQRLDLQQRVDPASQQITELNGKLSDVELQKLDLQQRVDQLVRKNTILLVSH